MGQPKAWLPFGPDRLLQRVVKRVSAVAAPIVVVAAPEQEIPALPPDVMVARDPVLGQGPVRGLATGLAILPDGVDLVFATATDVPFLEPDWIRLLESLIGDHEAAMPYAAGFYHPLAALYRRAAALRAINRLLQINNPRARKLMDLLRTRTVTAEELRVADPELATLRNLNTQESYHAALRDGGYPVTGTADPRRGERGPG